MIKSEVLNKDANGIDVSVAIRGEKEEIYPEIKSILDSFDQDPELRPLLVKAMTELVEKAMEV